MSEDQHRYRFYGFAGPYWDKKAIRERAELGEELTSGEAITFLVEEIHDKLEGLGAAASNALRALEEMPLEPEPEDYYCEQCHDWHGPSWDED